MRGQQNVINYDQKYDILYIFISPPSIAYEEEIKPGVFLRKDDDTDEVIGATISGYKNMNKSTLDDIIPFEIDHCLINDYMQNRM